MQYRYAVFHVYRHCWIYHAVEEATHQYQKTRLNFLFYQNFVEKNCTYHSTALINLQQQSVIHHKKVNNQLQRFMTNKSIRSSSVLLACGRDVSLNKPPNKAGLPYQKCMV